MDRLFELDSRLRMCAGMVRPGAKLADVGTDHAYLPVWLMKRGLISSAVAVDVRPGPLKRAEENIARYGAEHIVTRISDGLSAVSPWEADDVVLAGMGGELIARIVSEADWLRLDNRRLILQPMTRETELRLFLRREGFALLREEAAVSHGRVYTAMLAQYDPERAGGGELYPYLGRLSAESAAGRAYLKKQAVRLRRRAGGCLAEGKREQAAELLRIAEQIDKIREENER